MGGFGFTGRTFLFTPQGSISEEKLDSLSRHGAVVTSKKTHESIRAAISEHVNFPRGANVEIYLQGSYKNDTNVHGNSDVDIVVEITKPLNLFLITTEAQDRYTVEQWKAANQNILNGLRSAYGAARVKQDKKCIKVSATQSTQPADVVVAFRRFKTTYLGPGPFDNPINNADGMRFFIPSDNRWVTNYPKEHYSNGVQKNQRTNGWYKPLVRIFKNASAEVGLDTPSYFVECLIYNAPDQLFGRSYQRSFNGIINWLLVATLDTFVCQNKKMLLFGKSGSSRDVFLGLNRTPENWNVTDAKIFVDQINRYRFSF